MKHFDSALLAVATDIAAIELAREVVQSLLCQRQLQQLLARQQPFALSSLADRPSLEDQDLAQASRIIQDL